MKKGKRLNLYGQRFGLLVVLDKKDKPRGKSGKIDWICVCDCGNGTTARGSRLVSGEKISCGCLGRAANKRHSTTHGLSLTKEYEAWRQMRARCMNKNSQRYFRYGGRGIKICERWNSFENFLADMGECPSGYSIDRINNDGDYTPDNCRWATPKQQMRNRSNTWYLTFDGKTKPATEWADIVGIKYRTIKSRINSLGWTTEKALTTPTGG